MTDQQPTADAERTERRRNDPETLRIRSLTPSLTASDLERSMGFYVDGLGFVVEDRWEEEGVLRGVMLVAGGCRLGLSQDDFAKGRDRQKGIGFRIWAETAQDLDALARRARDHGIEHDEVSTESWGARTLSLVDPDGYKLTFTAAKDE